MNMVLVSEEYLSAYKIRQSGLKPIRIDKLAMVAFDGDLAELVKLLSLHGFNIGVPSSHRASFNYTDFQRAASFFNDDDPDRYSWKRWGR